MRAKDIIISGKWHSAYFRGKSLAPRLEDNSRLLNWLVAIRQSRKAADQLHTQHNCCDKQLVQYNGQFSEETSTDWPATATKQFAVQSVTSATLWTNDGNDECGKLDWSLESEIVTNQFMCCKLLTDASTRSLLLAIFIIIGFNILDNWRGNFGFEYATTINKFLTVKFHLKDSV